MTIRGSVSRVLSLIVVFTFTCPGGLTTAEDFFVDNEIGDDANDGTNQYFDAWATIQHAVNRVGKGDTIYVRETGLAYAPFTVNQGKITIVGWSVESGGHTGFDDGSGVPSDYDNASSWPVKRPINDANATLATDFEEIRDFDVNGVLGHTDKASSWLVKQPTIDANDPENGVGITVDADYVEIRNFEITDAGWGLYAYRVHDCVFENIFVYDVGDKVNADGAGEDGRGIHLYGSYDNIIANCVVYNSAGYGISSNSGYSNNVLGCRVYCDDNSTGKISATHYYFIVHDGNDHQIVGCAAERHYGEDGAPQHGGHGYVISAWTKIPNNDAWGNRIVNCTALDMDEAILLRGQIHDNTVENFESTSTGLPASPIAEGHIVLDSGPAFNHFYNVYLSAPLWAISILAPNGQVDDDPDSAARGNEFVNCIFECENAIRLWWLGDQDPQGESPYHVIDNEFFGCTFVGNGSGALFQADRRSSGNTFTNCIITGFATFEGTTQSDAAYVPGFELDHCCVYDADNANIPSSIWGDGNVEEDPDFQLIGLGAQRYQISGSSPCIDVGVADSTYPRNYDYGGTQRQGANYDIGAWELSSPGIVGAQPTVYDSPDEQATWRNGKPTKRKAQSELKRRRRGKRDRGRPSAVR